VKDNHRGKGKSKGKEIINYPVQNEEGKRRNTETKRQRQRGRKEKRRNLTIGIILKSISKLLVVRKEGRSTTTRMRDTEKNTRKVSLSDQQSTKSDKH